MSAVANPKNKTKKISEKAKTLLGDSLIFVAIGTAIGALGASAWTHETRSWVAIGLAALALIAGVNLRHRVSRFLAFLTIYAAAIASKSINEAHLRGPFAFIAPALGVASANAILANAISGWSGSVQWGATALALSLAIVGIFGAVASVAQQLIGAMVLNDQGRLLGRAAQIFVYAIAAAALLEAWGAPAAAAIAAITLVGLAVVFGARRQVGDWIAGETIKTEDRLRIGDWVEVLAEPPIVGEVMALGRQSAILRRRDGAIIDTPNSLFLAHATIVSDQPKAIAQKAVDTQRMRKSAANVSDVAPKRPQKPASRTRRNTQVVETGEN